MIITTVLKDEHDLKKYNNSKTYGNLIIDCSFTTSYDLTLIATKNIVFRANSIFTLQGNASVSLMSGIEDPDSGGRVNFKKYKKPQIFVEGKGKVYIYYNPVPKEGEEVYTHKYHNPSGYVKHVFPVHKHIPYMLVNNVKDLQDIMLFLHGNYALSNDIDASETKEWNGGRGFEPLTDIEENNPFSGYFSGNHYAINDLYINSPNSSDVGLFGMVVGQELSYARIENLAINNFQIIGKNYVGTLFGSSEYTIIKNIKIFNSSITGIEVIGGVAGTATSSIFNEIFIQKDTIKLQGNYSGSILGSTNNVIIHDSYNQCQKNSVMQCVGFSYQYLSEGLE